MTYPNDHIEIGDEFMPVIRQSNHSKSLLHKEQARRNAMCGVQIATKIATLFIRAGQCTFSRRDFSFKKVNWDTVI